MMEISHVKRVKSNPTEQYVSWKNGDSKGTVLVAADVDFANLSDAEKEAYVVEHAGLKSNAPAFNTSDSKPAGKPVEDLGPKGANKAAT